MKQKIRTASLLLLMVLGTGLVLMACGTKSLAEDGHHVFGAAAWDYHSSGSHFLPVAQM